MKPLTSKQWNALNQWMRNNATRIATLTPKQITQAVNTEVSRFVEQSHVETMVDTLRRQNILPMHDNR